MAKKYRVASLILAIIFGALAVITLPGYFSYFYKAGGGHAFGDIMRSENLEWDTMSDAERAPYNARVETEGLKCAILMVLGQFIPFYLFVLVTIGLLSRSISHGFRMFLRFAFFVVWIIGMLFLSFGTGYWGQAQKFPKSLGPAFLIYLALLVFFGIILGIGKLIQRATRKQPDQPPSIAQGQQ